MSTNHLSKRFNGQTAASSLLACVGAGAILFTAALAYGQNSEPAEGRGVFGNITHWVDEQASKLGSHFRGARSGVENFGHEAGVAAKARRRLRWEPLFTQAGDKFDMDAVAVRTLFAGEVCEAMLNDFLRQGPEKVTLQRLLP